MPQLLLGIVLVILLLASARMRRLLLHPFLWRMLFFFLGTLVILAIVGALGFFGWRWWQERYSSDPGTRWKDRTIWQNLNPVTPKTGRGVAGE
ncbi:MAG: hypothetical protein WC840_03835 [Candidatus Peribacteraceae bacterium]